MNQWVDQIYRWTLRHPAETVVLFLAATVIALALYFWSAIRYIASKMLSAITNGEKDPKVWSWWQQIRYGSVQIDHPRNGETVLPGIVKVEGSHKKAQGHFWLITTAKDQYWLQCDIDRRPDGTWNGTFHTNPSPGPRTCTLMLVRVSDIAHALFQEIQKQKYKHNDFGPMKLSPPYAEFKIVQALVVNVR